MLGKPETYIGAAAAKAREVATRAETYLKAPPATVDSAIALPTVATSPASGRGAPSPLMGRLNQRPLKRLPQPSLGYVALSKKLEPATYLRPGDMSGFSSPSPPHSKVSSS